MKVLMILLTWASSMCVSLDLNQFLPLPII
jgi:hypothetical protein